jgi:hypothetical protein
MASSTIWPSANVTEPCFQMTVAVCLPGVLRLPSDVRDVIDELLLCRGKVMHGKEDRFPPSDLTPKTSVNVEMIG